MYANAQDLDYYSQLIIHVLIQKAVSSPVLEFFQTDFGP